MTPNPESRTPNPVSSDLLPRTVSLGGGTPPVTRLGLASRGNTGLATSDVRTAVDKGINYLNWCGVPDGLSRAIREMAGRRDQLVVAVQFEARSAKPAERELNAILKELKTDYVDILTFYYVEAQEEWDDITGRGGSHAVLSRMREAGMVRLLGMTSHQRKLAAQIAQSGLVDLLMIRYNAAHRGAERDVFPVTDRLRMPVVSFTGVRWGALLQGTSADPPGFIPPTALDCYRYVLSHPSVAVALMAPDDRTELRENLAVLDDWRPTSLAERQMMEAHGDRVHAHAGSFP